MSTATAASPRRIRSTIPARLDRLKWSPFDTRMVFGLGAAWTLGGLQITIAYKATNDDPKGRRYGQLQSALGDLGMHHHHLPPHHAYLNNEIPVAGVARQAGTCRFGTGPGTSVLDVKCKAHELDNLYVADTSIFPSLGAVNPALTATANGRRVGDHLLERMRATWPTSTAASVR